MAYPHTRFRYKVEIEGLDAGGFSEVTGFDASIDVVEYREGDMVPTPQKLPGLKKYGNVTLRQYRTTPVRQMRSQIFRQIA